MITQYSISRSKSFFGARVRTPLCSRILIALALITMSGAMWAATGDAGTTFTGVGLRISNETVPPGGMLQLKVLITEPTPILKGRQRVAFSSPMLAAPRGIAAFSPAGDVSGVAVLKNGTAQVSFSSPLSSLGTNSDYPILTIALPVLPSATRGGKVNLTLDPGLALWFDSGSQRYPVELKSGVLTIGGTLSISDIQPGGGVVLAGKVIRVLGKGFQPTSVVAVKEAAIATSRYISPTEFQITLGSSVNMTGRRVQVKNSLPTSETASYYSYQPTGAVGTSTNSLMAASYPLFARSTWTQAYFHPVLSGTSFSGIAFQNLGASGANVRLELYSSKGALLTTRLLSIGVNSRITRELSELLPGAVPATGTVLRVISSSRIQILGLLGDTASGIVIPVEPASTP
jgi:hypothetical protein